MDPSNDNGKPTDAAQWTAAPMLDAVDATAAERTCNQAIVEQLAAALRPMQRQHTPLHVHEQRPGAASASPLDPKVVQNLHPSRPI